MHLIHYSTCPFVSSSALTREVRALRYLIIIVGILDFLLITTIISCCTREKCRRSSGSNPRYGKLHLLPLWLDGEKLPRIRYGTSSTHIQDRPTSYRPFNWTVPCHLLDIWFLGEMGWWRSVVTSGHHSRVQCVNRSQSLTGGGGIDSGMD